MEEKDKAKIYIFVIIIFSILISIGVTSLLKINNIGLFVLTFIILIIPSSEVVIQLIQYILGKVVKPKLIPKMDFSSGIDKENTTIVVIPSILKNKEKVK